MLFLGESSVPQQDTKVTNVVCTAPKTVSFTKVQLYFKVGMIPVLSFCFWMNHIVMKFPYHLKSVFNKNFEVLVDDLAPVGPPADDVTFCVPSTTYPCYWRYCYIFTIIQVRYGHSCIHIGNIDVYFFYNCIRLWVLSNDTCSPPWKILDMGQYHTVYRRFSWYDFLKFINGVFLCLSFVIWLLDISFSITSVFFFFFGI